MRTSRIRSSLLIGSCALFVGATALPGLAQSGELQATQCQVTPNVPDPTTEQEDFVFLGSATGTVLPPEPGGSLGMRHQALLQASCYSLGNASFTMTLELTFQRCAGHGCSWLDYESPLWTDENMEPLVCQVQSTGTGGLWVADLEVPGPGCPGSFLIFDWDWPSGYRAHVSLTTEGVDQPSFLEGYSPPYHGV
ncbi:MAG: hypothetical protein ACRDH9_13335 [Actinomycetota bacterium]